MKPAVMLLVAGWFGASVWAGYALAERSFAWIDEPRFGLPAPELPEALRGGNVVEIVSQLPKTAAEAAEKAKTLSPEAQSCLIGVFGEARIRAVLESGEFTPTGADLVAAMPCLKL